MVIYNSEKEKGTEITQSELILGFLNSDKKNNIDNPNSEMRFHPAWSSSGNIFAYGNDSGQIKIKSININEN